MNKTLTPDHPMFRPIQSLLDERTKDLAAHGFVKAEICKALANKLAIDVRLSTNVRWDTLLTKWDEGKIPDELVVGAFESAWKNANKYLEGVKAYG